MQYLKADTAVKVVVGPVVAVGDGFTPVTTLSLSTADEAEIMKHDASAVTSISSNTFAAITSMDGYYNLTITAAQLDTEGMLTVGINDDSLCLPVRHDYMVVNANVYDSLYAAASTDFLQVDTQQWDGNTVTASSGNPDVNVESIDNIDAPATWQASMNTQMDTAISDAALATASALATVDANVDAILVDTGTTLDTKINDIQGATFDTATDSLEAIRNRGDAAWTTGGGGSITDILNVVPLIPEQIDLANTATWRIGLMLTNAVDDLPTTAEITPGTISIDRKAIGGTSWSSVVSDSACSESAGLIYFDEVFDSGTGYAEGDSIRVTLKSQKITVAANDYEVTDATGRIFYTSIRQTMRGTDSAFLAANAPTNFADLAITASTGKVTIGTNDDKTGYSISGTKTTLDALNDITAATVLAAGDIDGFTLENAMKLSVAALAGKLSGAATTTVTIRAADDSKDRITATVDADGNRTAVTLDAAG